MCSIFKNDLMTAANFPIIVCRLYHSTTHHSLDTFFERVSTNVSARKCELAIVDCKDPRICKQTQKQNILQFRVLEQNKGGFFLCAFCLTHLRALTLVLTHLQKKNCLDYVEWCCGTIGKQ